MTRHIAIGSRVTCGCGNGTVTAQRGGTLTIHLDHAYGPIVDYSTYIERVTLLA